MKCTIRNIFTITLVALLTGCVAGPSFTPVGVKCDYSTGKPIWDLPLVCQPNGG